MENYDVVVVGGGPAGLSAAVSSSNKGAKTLLIERDDIYTMWKKSWVIPTSTVKEFGLEEAVENEMRKLTLITTKTGIRASKRADFVGGLVIDQRKFSRIMIEKGKFELNNKTEVEDVKRDNKEIIVKLKDKESIRTKLIVDASGIGSIIPQKLGKKTIPPIGNRCYGEMLEVEKLPEGLENDEIVFGMEPMEGDGGFRSCWIYPYNDHLVDIGVAEITKGMGRYEKYKPLTKEEFRKNMREKFEFWKNFYPEKKDSWKGAKVVRDFAGYTNRNIDHYPYWDNLLMVGDSAGHTYPSWHHGVEPCLIYGRICGEVTADAVSKGDLSKHSLKEYGKRLRKNSMHPFYTIFAEELARRFSFVTDLIALGAQKVIENDDIEMGYKIITGERMNWIDKIGLPMYAIAIAPKGAAHVMKQIIERGD